MSTNIGGTVTTDPSGKQNINVQAAHTIGSDKANLSAGVFASGTPGGNVTHGAFAAANTDKGGIGIQHSTTPGFGKTMSEKAHVNLFKNDQHAFSATASHSRTQMENGLKFDRVGGGTNWNSAQGHAASVGVTHVPQFNMTTLDAAAKANLWTSQNKASTFDLNANASRHLNGPFKGQNNFGAGVGFTHRF
ncbi:attacin-A-like [Teleopsis dalmanni]|uniref:attacin-A-like n=1 Tax=Teleopsis dalmanni TaxID=139649 RepID=UPI0018CEC73C|nr:attacin-A-like [Teleopsis dalmanni]